MQTGRDGSSTLVSVVIPVYNRVNTIERAIDSALDQTYDPVEVVAVDDGSTDGSREILQSYHDDPRVRVLYHDENRGANAARNAGIVESDGPLISFLDSDDELRSRYIQRVVEVFSEYDERVGLVYTSYRKFRNGELVDVTRGRDGRLPRGTLLATNPIGSFSAITVRRSVFDTIDLLDERFNASQDYELYVRLTRAFEVVGIDEPLVDRHLEESGIETSAVRRREGYRAIKAKFGDEIPRTRTADYHHSVGHILGLSGEYASSRTEFAKAVYYNPLNWRYHYFFLATLFGGIGYRAANAVKNRLNVALTRSR